MLRSKKKRSAAPTQQLRDLAPEGICDPPNPWLYQQLSRLCGDGLDGGTEPGRDLPMRGGPRSASTVDCFTCRDIEDPNERPYLWDLKEDDCKCQ